MVTQLPSSLHLVARKKIERHLIQGKDGNPIPSLSLPPKHSPLEPIDFSYLEKLDLCFPNSSRKNHNPLDRSGSKLFHDSWLQLSRESHLQCRFPPLLEPKWELDPLRWFPRRDRDCRPQCRLGRCLRIVNLERLKVWKSEPRFLHELLGVESLLYLPTFLVLW